MSRTNRQGGISSPIKKYVDYKGSTGIFSYWDKVAKKRVELKEIEIIPVEVAASFGGYDEKKKANFSSNMITNFKTDHMAVRSWKNGKAEEIADGTYSEVADKAKAQGAKFTTNLIGLADVGDGEELISINLISGTALGSWMRYKDGKPRDFFYDNKLTLSKGKLSKRNENGEYVPVAKAELDKIKKAIEKNPLAARPIMFYVIDFQESDLTEEDVTRADEVSLDVDAYFKSGREKYGAKEEAPSAVEATLETIDVSDISSEEPNDLPFD